jgi:hypothetical protein
MVFWYADAWNAMTHWFCSCDVLYVRAGGIQRGGLFECVPFGMCTEMHLCVLMEARDWRPVEIYTRHCVQKNTANRTTEED